MAAVPFPRDKAKIKLTDKVAPHVARETWVYIVTSFRDAIDSIPKRQHPVSYFSAGFGRQAEVADIGCICEQTLGDFQWPDKLSLPPQIGW
jgi:hypothetical protein